MRIWPLRVAALVCSLLFLVSAIMTGTYAWQSEQDALNNVYGNKTVVVPVELVKLEKQTDENAPEIAVPGTVFYLFRENGTQVGGRYVTDENGRINVQLVAGKYYFEEATPSIGYTYDTDQNGDPITRYHFTVTENDENITVKAYNIRLHGDLLIRKTVENTDGAPLNDMQKKTPFTFTVTFSDGGTYAYSIDNGEEQMLQSGGTLKLCSGQTAVFKDLPVGVLYNVVETPVEGYITAGTGHQANITDTQSVAEFINYCEQDELGSLTVTKEVRGDGADPDKEFTFTATIGDVTESFTLKDGESKEFIGIPVGSEYTVTEQDASDEGYYAAVGTYTGQIVSTETVVLPFVNIYNEVPPVDKPGSLTVSKTVIGENADPDREFTFEVVFTGAGAPESVTFTIKAGEEFTIDDIPHGVNFTVYETDNGGYWPVTELASGTIIGGTETEVNFINSVPTEETGSITVTKEVRGTDIDLNKTFAFTIDIDGEKQTFTLRHGESKTFAGLPIGTKYTVTESDSADDDYIATVKEYTGQIVGPEDVLLPFVNIYDPEPEGKLGHLTVKKVVIGDNADPDKEFTFTVKFEGENAPPEQTFTLKAGGSMTFADLPYGVTYTVTEIDAAGYEPVVITASGAIAGNQTSVVTFTNKVPETPENTVTLTVQKLLEGELIESDYERLFNITLTVDGKVTTFTLKADELKEFTVPVGAVYEVREDDYIKDGFSQFIANGTGIVTDEPIAVTVTNTYVGDPRVEIGGEKIWDMLGQTDVKLPESITVHLKNGELLVEEKIVKPDENGQWLYTFSAPKYNADGSLAEYTLEELPITSYRTSYDGYNIINTYVKPLEVDPPIITKVVSGENAPSSPFEFVFTGKHGTPMPEGSEGYRKTLTLNGAGELEIGTITFTDPGEYVYTVHEKNSGGLGWKYDTALYTITYTVTEKDHVLTAERTIVKNSSPTDRVVFTNTFEQELGDNIIISGTKTWNHGSNPEKNRPAYIIVEVYGDGGLIIQRQVTANDNWQYFFELPRFDENGEEIVYTIDEVAIKDYEKKIDGYDLVNTYVGKPFDPSDPGGSSPETGDRSNLVFWITLMILSLIGLIVTSLLSKKSNTNRNKPNRRPRRIR